MLFSQLREATIESARGKESDDALPPPPQRPVRQLCAISFLSLNTLNKPLSSNNNKTPWIIAALYATIRYASENHLGVLLTLCCLDTLWFLWWQTIPGAPFDVLNSLLFLDGSPLPPSTTSYDQKKRINKVLRTSTLSNTKLNPMDLVKRTILRAGYLSD